MEEEKSTTGGSDDWTTGPGVGDLWTEVNHVAIVVTDVGRSLHFYTDVVGMKQVMRPDFDRHGAWLLMGNLSLHLIKGVPAVHPDSNLIVGHIALVVADMAALRSRLTSLGVETRKNISVPNPSKDGKSPVDQAFLRDPDGYYIEFCACHDMEESLIELMSTSEHQRLSLAQANKLVGFSKLLRKKAEDPEPRSSPRSPPSGVSDEEDMKVDEEKLGNLMKRRAIYGDIIQTATESELKRLLHKYDNQVPQVIKYLEDRCRKTGWKRVIPPAFYDRDGTLFQPPPFDIEINKLEDVTKEQ